MYTRRLLSAAVLTVALPACMGGPEQETLYSEQQQASVMITPLYWDSPGTSYPADADVRNQLEDALEQRMSEIGWNTPIQYVFRSLTRQAWQELDTTIVQSGIQPVVANATLSTVDTTYHEITGDAGRPGKAVNFDVRVGDRSSRFSIDFVDIAHVYGHPIRVAGPIQPSREGFDFNLLYDTRGYYSTRCDVMRASYDEFSDAWTGQDQAFEDLVVSLQPDPGSARTPPVSPVAALLDAMAVESYWVDNAGFSLHWPWENPDEAIETASGETPNHIKLQLRCMNDLYPQAAHLIVRVDFLL